MEKSSNKAKPVKSIAVKYNDGNERTVNVGFIIGMKELTTGMNLTLIL
jgi:hypothetical protein